MVSDLIKILKDNAGDIGVTLVLSLVIFGLLWSLSDMRKAWAKDREAKDKRDEEKFKTVSDIANNATEALTKNAVALTEVATLVKIGLK